MITVNAYTSTDSINDVFPVNTWKGNKEQVLECISNLLNTTDVNGIARLDVVIDPKHELNFIGQAPRYLEDEPIPKD